LSPRDPATDVHPHEELPAEPLSPLARGLLDVVARHGYDLEAAIERVDAEIAEIGGVFGPDTDRDTLREAVETVLAATDGTDPPASFALDRAVLYVDGSARGNPGPAGAGAVVQTTDGETVARLGRPVGSHTDNNTAEYAALHMGLAHLDRVAPATVAVRIDSMTVIDDVWRDDPAEAGDGYRVPIADRLRAIGDHDWVHLVDSDPNPADGLATVGADVAAVGPGG